MYTKTTCNKKGGGEEFAKACSCIKGKGIHQSAHILTYPNDPNMWASPAKYGGKMMVKCPAIFIPLHKSAA